MIEGPIQVLLVDDDEITNFLSCEILSHHRPGIHIKAISSAEEALSLLQKLSEDELTLPGIILVDINMPWMNGWDFLERFENMKLKGSEKVRIYIYTSSVYYKDFDKSKTFDCVAGIFSKPMTDEMLQILFSET
jgi:two-component SAPR family response regulator